VKYLQFWMNKEIYKFKKLKEILWKF
jgi:hypothetical protein